MLVLCERCVLSGTSTSLTFVVWCVVCSTWWKTCPAIPLLQKKTPRGPGRGINRVGVHRDDEMRLVRGVRRLTCENTHVGGRSSSRLIHATSKHTGTKDEAKAAKK